MLLAGRNRSFVILTLIIMSTAELKYNLVKLIESINNSRTLQAVYTLLSNKKEGNADFWDELSAEQKAAIEESIGELDRGEGIPHEQVMKEIKSKYNI